MASRSSVDQLGGARQDKVKPDGTEQLEDNRANAASRGRPDAKSVQTAMVSSLEVADNFVPNDADKQESKVHHALVGTVNSTASGAQSQDGGVSAQLFWSYLLNQGEYGTWEIMHPWISSNGASWKWFTVYYAALVAHKNGDLKRSAGLKKAADAEQRNGGSRSASWIREAFHIFNRQEASSCPCSGGWSRNARGNGDREFRSNR